MLFPAATGFGDPLSVTVISALEPTLATSVAISFNRLASPPPPTIAVFVNVAGDDCDTRAFIVIEGKALPAAKASERAQLTVCAETEHDQPVPAALVGVMPVGSVSLIVTTPLVGP